MNIVIIGAGDVGRYLASILSKEQHNIILVDKNLRKLQDASNTMDVATRHGIGTDWQLLDDLLELSPHLLIALTDDDETNMMACSIAKHLGYPRTVARLRDNKYLNKTRLDFARMFDVDHFIAPDLLVANDILKFMLTPGSLNIENFSHGAVQMKTVAVPMKWKYSDQSLAELEVPQGVMVGLIRREIKDPKNKAKSSYRIIFPHGEDHILPGDEVTFIGETDVMLNINQFMGISQKKIESAVIVGGSRAGINLAKLLAGHDVYVKVIDKNYEKCIELAELLPNTNIIHQDATDLPFLQSEKIGEADVLAACTRSDEVNLMSALLAKTAGCPDVIVMLTNYSYASIAPQLGINYTASPRISAANHVLSQILAGKVTSLVSLYENQAEIIEVNVSMDSKLVGIPLSDLGPILPRDFLIAMIQNRGRIMIAHGGRIISPGDTVIVITSPKHIRELEKIF